MNDWAPLWLTLRVASTAGIAASILGVALGYVLAKSRARGRGVIEAVLTAPIVLPPTVLGYYLLTTLGVRSPFGRLWERAFGSPLVFTVAAATIAATVSALPYVVRASRAAIESVDAQIEASGRASGLSEFHVARLITLPLARRGIGAGLALGFARALGDFGVTVMVAGNIPGKTQTLPIAIYDAVQSGDQRTAGNGALLLGALAVALLIVVGRLSQSGVRDE
jgi:molybdate transport system permease protein